MPFQSTVFFSTGLSVPGEIWSNTPIRSQSYILQSVLASQNIIGATAYTIVSQGIARAGGTGAFAGFLVMPKDYALYGLAGTALSPTMTLANEVQADILSMGTIVVTLPGPAAIGDVVLYDTATGALQTVPPGTALPVGTASANAYVDYFTVTAAGLAVITVNPNVIVP